MDAKRFANMEAHVAELENGWGVIANEAAYSFAMGLTVSGSPT
jgi:hypothetical protein